MLLKIIHTTDLHYSEPINESVMELRVVPRQENDQRRLSFNLAIGPATSTLSYFDWLGNTVHAYTINAFHDQIRIVATSVVETDRNAKSPNGDVWPPQQGVGDFTMYDFLQFGGPVVDSTNLEQIVAQLNPQQNEPLAALADRMIALINDRFTYKPGVTTAASPITEMLEHGQGVCQDFTHLMLGMCRALKIPARYVSGYLHPQSERFRGYTQTHAWCELYFPSTGWIGFDAANRCRASEHFVKIAIGRDFRDVPPNKGVYRGQGKESMTVKVESSELENVPPDLASDRMRSLDVPTLPQVRQPHMEAPQQQEHQQQQQ